MRLLTHNFLQSTVRGTTGYPLIIEADEIVVEETPMDKILLAKMVSKLDTECFLAALRQIIPKYESKTDDAAAAAPLPSPEDLREQLNSMKESKGPPEKEEDGRDDGSGGDEDEAALRNLHRAMFDIHVIEGHLICPVTGRRYPIKEGIPNMLLHEDEI